MQENRHCQNCKKEFRIEPEDFLFYEKIKVPSPTFCPDCRQQQRILFRNFKTLYKSKSALSGKDLISMYATDSPYTVYDHAEWWDDTWDAQSYAQDIDYSRPFFEQFQELLLRVPKFNLMNTKSENCLYSNMTAGSKNCYLVFGCLEDENCAYGHIVWNSKDCIDNLYIMKSELCYECIDCTECYKLFYSQECERCNEGIGLFDCRDCQNCIGCVGLSKKSYHIFNEQVTKEEYALFLSEHPLSDPASILFILERQKELRLSLSHRHFFGMHNEDISGNHLYNSKNIHSSFDVKGGEDSKFIFTGRSVIDCYDCSFFPDLELGYQNLFCTGRMILFSHLCIACNDVWYSESCFSSNNLFGCVGMRNAKYCILNKQYSPVEFEKIKTQLVEHMKKTDEWGSFFPKELSPFAYNESIVNEYTPLAKEQALIQGFRWKDGLPGTSGQETISYDQLPKNPSFYSPDLNKHILACADCGKNYRFIAQEIDFYKTHGLALPRLCFNCRHMQRMRLRNPRKLWMRSCMCNKLSHNHSGRCPRTFETSYDPDRPEIVCCSECYSMETV